MDQHTVGVQAIPDQITRSQLPIDSFGGCDAPWAQELMTAWNGALEWRKNEASNVARELLYYSQALGEVAEQYGETDTDSGEDIARYEHA